jgi:hypothetical protein
LALTGIGNKADAKHDYHEDHRRKQRATLHSNFSTLAIFAGFSQTGDFFR